MSTNTALDVVRVELLPGIPLAGVMGPNALTCAFACPPWTTKTLRSTSVRLGAKVVGVGIVIRLVTVALAAIGAGCLAAGYAREHRDLARLFVLATGWLALAATTLLIAVGLILPSLSRRRVHRQD